MAERGLQYDQAQGFGALAQLAEPEAVALVALLGRFPETVQGSAANLEPHVIAQYLRDLAAAFHGYYHALPFLIDDAALRNARLALAQATGQVLRNGLALLGVSAPEKM